MVTVASAPSHAVDYDPFADGALSRVVPTTEPQREVWLADHLGRDASLAYNESVSLQLRGPLSAPALQAALQALVDRHEALRSSFDPDGESLCVRECCTLSMAMHNLSHLPPPERDVAVQARLLASVETPFAVGDDLLFRAELLRLAPDEHRLVLSAHHIVCDGWSWWIIVRELGALYAHVASGATGAAPLSPAASFADYALAEALNPHGETFADDQAYWRSRFDGELPVLDLPTDRPRPLRRSFASRREDHVLGVELVAAVRRMGAKRGASLFATLLGGFAGLVSRLAGQSDVVVGIPAAGQSVDGHDSLVGHCVNLLPLRFDIDSTQPFAASLDAAQSTLLDALDHQRYTFGSLLKQLPIARDPGRLPLVSVMFNIDQALDQESNGFPGLALDFTTNPRRSENFELSINAVQVDGTLRLECQYSTALFDEATIRRWLSAYETLLREAVEHPERAFAALPLVDATARAELAALQPEPVAFDRLCRMHEHFERQCDRTPDDIAVRHRGQALTYAELESRANRIARLLRARGAKRGTLVGLALDRGIDMLAGLLGILKSGAGYVPLDPQFPADRLAYMAGDAGLAVLLTQRRYVERIGADNVPTLVLDESAAEIAAQAVTRLGRDELSSLPESPAYVIYTSGSTGRPKGVQVPHRAIANFLVAMQREPGLDASDRLVAVTTLSFDIAVLELLLPLSVGAEVILASRDEAMDGHALAALIAGSGATVMQATPATWRVLLEAGWQGGGKFKVLCGGEPLPADLALQLLPRCGELWNVYGPTETTVWSTCARVLAPPAGLAPDIHIGRPVANTRVWIVDANGELCPLGVPGEICIGGDGVTLGYLDRPELTADRFIAERFVSGVADGAPAPLLYRTGDRGRWRSDGNLEHLGRLDFQVKVRGYRIELGEIETQLANHASVARALVIVREDRPSDVRLVAYVVTRAGQPLDDAALVRHLKSSLPDYMIPQHVVGLEAVPLLPNGKINRNALPVPGARVAAPAVAVATPRDALEVQLAAAFAATLGRTSVGIDDGFFELGGHSLLAAQLCSRLSQQLGTRIDLRTLFEAPTVSRLAAFVRASSTSAPDSRCVTARGEQSTAPLSLQQQRLWFLEQMDPGQVTYNTPSAHRLHGPMDVVAFDRAFREMIRRQASLRTTIVQGANGPVQSVAGESGFSLLPLDDLSALPAAERDGALMASLEAMTGTPFALDGAPLFRARLFRLADDDHVFYFMTHHLIWDGWSFDVFYDEMSALYAAYSQGKASTLPELELSYGDFAQWQREWMTGGELSRQLAHWTQHLAGPIEPLRLQEDFPRPARASGKGGTGWVTVDRGTADSLRQVGVRADATLFMTLLAAYYVLLHRLSGQTDLVVGLPMRNRHSEALEKVMGFFVNMLPMRLRLTAAMPFVEVVAAVRRAVVEAFAYPDVPFENLVRELKLPRDTSRSPLYQAVFSFQDVRARKTQWGPLRHEHLLLFQNGISSDLGLWFLEHEKGLSGALAFNTDILSTASAERINRDFVALLAAVCRNPDAPLSALGSTPVVAAAVEPPSSPAAVAPSPASTTASAGDDIDRRLAAIMADVLGQDRVGVDDDFFAIGGHSLLAMQLNARIGRELAVSLPLRVLFDAPTVRQLAAAIVADRASPASSPRPPIEKRDEQALAPLSLMQQSLWLLEQFSSDQTALNLPAGLRLRGDIDEVALDRAFAEMVRRQPSLRTSIDAVGEQMMQRVHDDLVFSLLPAQDLSSLPTQAREATLQSRIDALVLAPFELDQAPLFRAALFRLAPDEVVLQFVAHHIIWDGWSFNLFHDELARLYSAFRDGGSSPLPALARSYGDFAAWQRAWLASDAANAEVAHWLGVLTPVADALDLPADRTRPVQMSGQGATLPLAIGREAADRARAVGQRSDATLFMTVLAAYVTLLHRLTGQSDLVIGIPVRGRDTVDMETVMGLFRNTLPLRIVLEPTWSFSRLVVEVRTRMLEALARPEVPFEQLVHGLNAGRDFSRHPIYQALFSFQDRRAGKSPWQGLHAQVLNQFPRGATEDIGLWFDETAAGLDGGMAYNADIVDAASAQRFVDRFLVLFDALVDAPDRPLSQLDALTTAETSELARWNDTARDYPREACIHSLIDAQALRQPTRRALSFEGRGMTYAAMQSRANRIARVLADRGVGPGALVGLCLERGFDMVVAVLAVLKAGAAYVPLDPVFPRDRLEFMATDAGLAMLVTSADLADVIDWPRDRQLRLDEDAALIDAASDLPIDVLSTPASIAYVLYTSGSTGKPKGVQVPHGAVVNFLLSMQREPGLTADDRLVAVTTLSFDIAALELFLPLTCGAEVVIASREQAREGEMLQALIEQHDVTVMQATPTTWQLLLDVGWAGRSGFRALVGGEALAPDLAAQLLQRCSAVWNMYGPTETTVWSTCWKVSDPANGISIGRPIANTTIHVLGEHGQVCPAGVAGEIWIGGDGVTAGYLHRPELTAERFVVDPHSKKSNARMYRTGDRGRWLADGTLQHLGRLDFQVKVRGYRIELGEIDNALLQAPDVARAITIAREDRPGDVRLVAYAVPTAGTSIDPAAVVAHLKRTLPDYMVPQHVVALDALPQLPNGKIDRKALPMPVLVVAADSGASIEKPSDARVGYLMGLWTELLGVAAGPADNFFDLGGHSMLAVQMANRVAKDTGVRIRLIRLATQSLAQIAQELPAPATTSAPDVAPVGWMRRLVRGVANWFGPRRTPAP